MEKNVLVIIENARMAALLEAYPLKATNEKAPTAVADSADDWRFFAARDILPGSGGRRNLGFSPSLGVSRHLTMHEAMHMKSWDETHYVEASGPVDDLLSEAMLAARDLPTGERRFHIRLSYSTMGDNPEDALKTFFEAVKRPGAMVAEIFEEGVDSVVEIDGDEIVALSRGAFADVDADQNGPEI